MSYEDRWGARGVSTSQQFELPEARNAFCGFLFAFQAAVRNSWRFASDKSMPGPSTTPYQRFDVTSVSKGARVSAMGCGGSRTDALEPRYLESWTKETESTWLTGTDADIPLSSIHSIPSDGSEACFASEKNAGPGKGRRALKARQRRLKWHIAAFYLILLV